MFDYQFFLGVVVICATVLFHVVMLVLLASRLRKVGDRYPVIKKSTLGLIRLISIMVLGLVVIHSVEAWAWAQVFYFAGEFENLDTALYFSFVTITTLGYGDITLSENWQLLAGFEAMGGLMLFGVSTAFLIGSMRILFEE